MRFIEEFLKKLETEEASASLISKTVSALRLYGIFLNTRGYEVPTTIFMKKPKQRVERRTLCSDEQVRKIIRESTCELKDKDCALIIYEGCVIRVKQFRDASK